MKYLGFLIIFLVFIPVVKANNLLEYTNKVWKLNQSEYQYLQKGQILAVSKVTSIDNKQQFHLKAMALHPNKCSRVLRKLSQLENFSQWISFIKKSTYSDESKLFTLRAEHTLLPFPMIVHIIVDRPTKVGTYPFTFPTGLFTGLKGHFEIKDIDNKCLFYATSFWKGKPTRVPNLIIEIFSEGLTKMGGDILMRKIR